MIFGGEWWDYETAHIFEDFWCQNSSVAPHSASKFHIFHFSKIYCGSRKSIPEPLKIDSIFKKSIPTEGRVSLVLYAESADYLLTSKGSVFADFFSCVINNKIKLKDRFKMLDTFFHSKANLCTEILVLNGQVTELLFHRKFSETPEDSQSHHSILENIVRTV